MCFARVIPPCAEFFPPVFSIQIRYRVNYVMNRTQVVGVSSKRYEKPFQTVRHVLPNFNATPPRKRVEKRNRFPISVRSRLYVSISVSDVPFRRRTKAELIGKITYPGNRNNRLGRNSSESGGKHLDARGEITFFVCSQNRSRYV